MLEFRDLKKQYACLKDDIDSAIAKVCSSAHFIGGSEVSELEADLASYIGVKHCISCANGTEAITLALMAWGIKPRDAVFVPDFTFFASAEAPALIGATPVLVDVDQNTFNIDPQKLEQAILAVLEEGELKPKAVIAVDLFGLPANYAAIREICSRFNLLLLEDAAQGFGGAIDKQRACSFGDISTTSFFPAKPLGCYGDGGAIFTDNDEWASLIRSFAVHGKGSMKYDNVRIGVNSRLDSIQAAILKVKLRAFKDFELNAVNKVAEYYTRALKNTLFEVPFVPGGYFSSWAQYTLRLSEGVNRDDLQVYLRENGIPSMVYYPKPLAAQSALQGIAKKYAENEVTASLCKRVVSIPMHPYLEVEEMDQIICSIKNFFI